MVRDVSNSPARRVSNRGRVLEADSTVIRKSAPLPDASPERTRRAYLMVVFGEPTGREFKLVGRESIIGRSEQCDIRVIGDEVSRQHAKIVRDTDGTVKLVDLKSTNGTLVNDKKISVEVLRDGDRIRLGSTTLLRFRYEYEGSLEDSVSDSAEVEGLENVYDNIAVTLDNLGRMHDSNRRFDQALEAYKRTLKLREKKYGPHDPSVAAILERIGTVLREQGHHDQALARHRRALSIYEINPNPNPRDLVPALLSIGECHIALGSGPEAVPVLERALGTLLAGGGASADLARARLSLARALALRGGEGARARRLAEESREGYVGPDDDVRKHMAQVEEFLAGLPE